MDKLKRHVVLCPERLWRRLKAILAAQGLSVSAWFRKVAEAEVERRDRDG